MTIARKRQVCPETTPYYHVYGRCVRRAFLCGFDKLTGRSFEHRRQWVVDRLKLLAEVFAIEVVAFSVMENHVHIVLKLNPDAARAWSLEEIRDRWAKLYGTPPLIELGLAEDAIPAVREQAEALLEVRRERLADLSWFMKCLNEHIAREANKEDQCTGSFWEGRYKSQALLDEKALLACMAYVDLNPIHAEMAKTPETSDYTSIQQRLGQSTGEGIRLALFRDQAPDSDDPIPCYLRDYIELVDWTGRARRNDKRGSIPEHLAPALERIGFDEAAWHRAVRFFGSPIYKVVGPVDSIRMLAKRTGRSWFWGTSACATVFGPG